MVSADAEPAASKATTAIANRAIIPDPPPLTVTTVPVTAG
jgi:hypothetical protein